jgi:chorismate mutase
LLPFFHLFPGFLARPIDYNGNSETDIIYHQMLNNHWNNPRMLFSALLPLTIGLVPNLRFRLLLALCVTIQLELPVLAQAQTTDVFQLINERLGYMEDVALYKAENNLPVEDLARESIVIENAVLAAESAGLIGASIENFFVSQIDDAKAIQYRSLADWLSAPISREIPDLENDIRPKLTELGDRIVAELALFLDANGRIEEAQRESFHAQISVRNVSTADKDRLFNSLLLVRIP